MFIICSYCLSQTELFLNSLLDQGPVKTVVAPELPHSDHHRTPSKEREKVAVVHKSSQREILRMNKSYWVTWLPYIEWETFYEMLECVCGGIFVI